MTEVLQYRYKANDKQVISACNVIKNGRIVFSFFFVELAWKNNRPNVSCIPALSYWVEKRTAEQSSKFKYPHFEVMNVRDRSAIKWHVTNYYHQLQGCQAPGKNAAHDIDGDGQIDVVDSTVTLGKLNKILPKRFMLHITEKHDLYEY